MLVEIAAFSAAAALIVLLPGPDTLVVLRSLLRHGRPHAGWTVIGVLSGLAIWVCVAALGLSAVLRASDDAYLALRVAGGIYLIWLGVRSLRARLSGASTHAARHRQPRRPGLMDSGYAAGLATDLLNPKVGVFFVTFLPGFVPPGQSVGVVSLLLGAIFIVEAAAYFAILLVVSGSVTRWLDTPQIRRRMDRITGAVLIAFGVRLVLEP
ncbi:MAG: LysE family translocator [Actinomycetota bacterium]